MFAIANVNAKVLLAVGCLKAKDHYALDLIRVRLVTNVLLLIMLIYGHRNRTWLFSRLCRLLIGAFLIFAVI
jgi:hypothetical protein